MGTLTAVNEAIASNTGHTPLFDGLVIEKGFDPDRSFTLPEIGWSDIPKRKRNDVVRFTGKILAALNGSEPVSIGGVVVHPIARG